MKLMLMLVYHIILHFLLCCDATYSAFTVDERRVSLDVCNPE
jgi:hypothetical protein